MSNKINLDGKRMNVVETASNGVVNHETIFNFSHSNKTVTAKYAGGKVVRGFLIGQLSDNGNFQFKYAQEHEDGNIAGGESNCEVGYNPNGKLQLIENFEWGQGRGRNVFQELN